MRVFSILLILLTIVGASFADMKSKKEAQTLAETVVAQFSENNIERAFSLLEPHLKIDTANLEQQKKSIIAQRAAITERYGISLGYEFVKEDRVKSFLSRYVFVEKFESEAIRWIFIFYKPKNKWMLRQFYWDDRIPELFE